MSVVVPSHPLPFKSRTMDFKSRTTDFKSRTADFKKRTTDFKSRTMDFKSRTMDFKKRTTDFKSRTTDFKKRTADIESRTMDIKMRTADIKKRTADIEKRTADIKITSPYKEIKGNNFGKKGEVVIIREKSFLIKNLFLPPELFNKAKNEVPENNNSSPHYSLYTFHFSLNGAVPCEVFHSIH
jgi:hypothetical protein